MLDLFGPSTPPEPMEVPPALPVLPLRDLVIFPYIIVPLSVGRDRSIKSVESALAQHRMLLLVTQKSEHTDNPGFDGLHRVGTVAHIMRVLKLPDGRVRILVQGIGRARIEFPTEEGDRLEARVQPLSEPDAPESLERMALVRSVKAGLERVVALGRNISSEVMVIAANLQDPGRLADLAASNLELKLDDAQALLEMLDPLERLREVLQKLNREVELLQMQQQITTQARSEIDRGQREYYLRQQLKAIEKELGEGSELNSEIQQLRDKVTALKLPATVATETLRQIEKLARMHPDGAETAMLRNYLDWMTTLPWGNVSPDRVDLVQAREILDRDHHGLEKVKERILEFLAVRKLAPKAKGPLLCFVGPPGVGKTSLGRSIAAALGRKFHRLSLGGVRDEAEIRGHRRTYVGAMPGRILQGLHQCGTSNPVFMIDEVDKIGADFRGDPSSALLEVLDPEQNSTFRDHYLNVPYDLSGVLFIATANLLDPVQPAFRDRMEVISIEGYSEEDKVEIARRHLLPRALRDHGLSARQVGLDRPAMVALIRGWTREAGLRNLGREIAGLCRKGARAVAEQRKPPGKIAAARLNELLGAPRSFSDQVLHSDRVGVAAGLAWTAAGGEILLVETLALVGRGHLQLTGQLGAVMKESAAAGLSWLRSRAEPLGIAAEAFRRHDLHVHIAEGAIPKDGPSAGITMAAAMASALTGRPVRHGVAMTGEITLRGDVLPVGGIREKVLAARRAGVVEVLLPEANRRDIGEVRKSLLRGIRVRYVRNMDEVLERALVPLPRGRKALKTKARTGQGPVS